MKQLTVRVIAVLLLSVVAFATFQIFTFKNTVANKMSDNLGVDVDVSAIRLGWNSVTVSGLTIDNIPEGTLNPAFSGDKIQLTASVMSVLRDDKIVVDELIILSPHIAIETFDSSGADNNWSRMIRNFTADDDSTASSSDEAKAPRQWEIKHLLVKDISVELRHPAASDKTLRPRVPDIELNNVTSLSQIPIEAITQAVMDEVLKQALLQIPKLIQEMALKPGGAVDKVLNGKDIAPVKDALKGLLDK